MSAQPNVTRNKVTPEIRRFIIRELAAWSKPPEVRDAVKREFGLEISREAIWYYLQSERWREPLQRERRALEEADKELPVSSRYWRQKQREEIIAQARQDPRTLQVARGALLDAARESGDLEESPTQLNQVNVQVINEVFQLPLEALERFAETGTLDPSTFLPDVTAASAANKLPAAGPSKTRKDLP